MYLLNRSPTKANSGHTPEEIFSQKVPNLRHLRAIGCLTFVHVPDRYRNKLQQRAEKGALVGYDDSTKGYRVYLSHKRTVTVTHDVAFDESRIYKRDNIAPQFDVEKLLELRPNYSIPEYPEAVRDHFFEKQTSSMSPHETLAEISGGGDCMTTPKANKPTDNHNGVAENYERVSTSPALSTPTSHRTTGTEIREAGSPIQSGPSSTFKGKSFSTPNSARFPNLPFFH